VGNDGDGAAAQAGISLYDVVSGKQLTTMSSTDNGSIHDVAFSPDGRYVLAVVGDRHALIWDTTTGKTVFEPPLGSAAVTRFAMSPSGGHVALGRDDGQVAMWTLRGTLPARALDIQPSPHHAGISWIDFDPKGERMVSSSRDGSAVVWDTVTGKLAARPRPVTGRALAYGFFRPGSSDSLMSIDSSGQTWEWDLQKSTGLLTTVAGTNQLATVSSSPEPDVLVLTPTGAMMVYHPSGPAPRELSFESGRSRKWAIVASDDGTRFVVVYYDDGRVELRDTSSGATVVNLFQHKLPSPALTKEFGRDGEIVIALDRRGTRVAYQGDDQRIEVVDDDGTRLPPISLSFERRNLQSIDLSDDGSELVISTQTGEAIWYDLEGIDAASIAPEGTGFDAQFVSEDRIAVVGTGGGQIIDPRSRRTTDRFNFGADFTRLAVDDTGRLLATVDNAGAVQLWNADPVSRVGEAIQIQDVFVPVPIRFSSDGHYLLVSGPEEATWVDVWTADWREVACSLVTERLSPADVALYLGSSEDVDPCP
jgi:WD40 repeat protein